MSGDIFTGVTGSSASNGQYDFAGGSLSRSQYGDSTKWVPMDPETQRLEDKLDAERDIKRAREEAEMNTPENRQKAFEAEMAERKRKKIDFHGMRAIPRCLEEGWRHIRGDFTDEEIRVYTVDNERRRFWGIKPAGMGMYDFWEENDPEVGRYDDKIATTWASPLVPPPVTSVNENIPVIWAGQGLNPDVTPREPSIATAPPRIKAVTKSRKRQKTSEVDSAHRVRKSTVKSSKLEKNTQKSLAHKINAGSSGLDDHMREVPTTAHANDRSTLNKTDIKNSDAQQKSATGDEGSAFTKRRRGRPATKTKSVADDSKRPRGRPPAKGRLPKKSPKQKKTPAVKGNVRVTKPSQTERRPAPSTHKMRTRGKGPAEVLQLR